MSHEPILSYGGKVSQTGLAVTKRFPAAEIHTYTDFEKIGELLLQGCMPLATPVWNSHKGEIRDSNVWEHLLEERGCLVDVWPGCIEFWFVTRRAHTSEIKRICSVKVAKQQCSKFLDQFNAEFIEYSSTVVALEAFIADESLDAVLIAPDQLNDDGRFSILKKKTANPNNFTTFALLIPRSHRQAANEGDERNFTAVSMPAFQLTLSDDQKEFFERLLEPAEHLNNVPRLLFVFNRVNEAASVGLLFQGPVLREGDLLSADLIDQDIIRVVEEAGNTPQLYANELDTLLKNHFPEMRSGPFIKHRGDNAWLFACPPLGIYTHGYDETAAEPVRYYISRIFKLLSSGVQCTPEQRAFFEQHEQAWQENDTDFIEFKLVG